MVSGPFPGLGGRQRGLPGPPEVTVTPGPEIVRFESAAVIFAYCDTVAVVSKRTSRRVSPSGKSALKPSRTDSAPGTESVSVAPSISTSAKYGALVPVAAE